MDLAPKNISLSIAERKTLLLLARKTLTHFIEHDEAPTVERLGLELTAPMEQMMGGFVSLHNGKNLRGCIGEITPTRALYLVVMAQAVNAGVHDYRFKPVTIQELPQLTFEISALTPARPVQGPGEIRIGRDGVVLTKGRRSAVFLPQVAPAQGWNVEQMLEQLAHKAGLSKDAWCEGATFKVFQAIVFSEKD